MILTYFIRPKLLVVFLGTSMWSASSYEFCSSSCVHVLDFLELLSWQNQFPKKMSVYLFYRLILNWYHRDTVNIIYFGSFYLPPTKAVPTAANRIGFLSFITNIFKIVSTRAPKSDMHPSMLVALTPFNQSVQKKYMYCVFNCQVKTNACYIADCRWYINNLH